MSVASPERWNHEAVTMSVARGCIFDTNAKSPSPKGRFDFVVYDDGLLAIHGNYLRTAILGGSGGAGAGGPSIAAVGAVVGTEGLRGYDLKRFAATASHGRDELLAGHPSNHFLPVSEIAGLVLRHRWYEHSLQVDDRDTGTRTYRWKPKLNRIDYVVQLLTSTFGVLFRVE
jgi:hypothetical protein